jgi:hypothetical protein
MNLNKSYVREFENISPPLQNAVTIPVEGTNVVIYVGSTPFNPATREQVTEVVKNLTLGTNHGSEEKRQAQA